MSRDIVHVWLVRTDVTGLASLEPLLDSDERLRARAILRPDARRRFTVAHAAFRLILSAHLGVPPGQLRWQHGPHGKPALAGLPGPAQVSISHTGGLSALAVSPGRRVGVDIERRVAGLDVLRVASRFYPADEARYVAAPRDPARQVTRFLRLWTRKEACVKVTGGRLLQGLALPARGSGPVTVHTPGAALPGPYLVCDLAVPPGCHAALAVEDLAPYQIRCHGWPAVR